VGTELELTNEFPDIVIKTIAQEISRLNDIEMAIAFGEFITESGLAEMKAASTHGFVAGVSLDRIDPLENYDTTHDEGHDLVSVEIYVAASDMYDQGEQHWRGVRAAQAVRAALQGKYLLTSDTGESPVVQSSPFAFSSMRRYLTDQLLGSYILSFQVRVRHGNDAPKDLFRGSHNDDIFKD
jgi:hypothetical protein